MPAKTKKPSSTKARQVKTKPYSSFRLHKRTKHAKPLKTGAFKLFRYSLQHLWDKKKLFFGVVLVYLLLTIIMVKGLGVSIGAKELKDTLDEAFTGSGGTLLTGITIFGVLVSTTSSASSDVAGVYQTILVVITSLALIWALRQTYAGNQTTVRASFYAGMYALVPFLLVLGVVGLQLVPLIIANWLYVSVIAGGIAVTGFEQFVAGLLSVLLALLSLYMISSSLFALYIVTLPDMTPLKALRSARELVRFRRWAVMRKVLVLPIILLVLSASIMMPLIIFAAPLAEWVYFVLSMLGLAVVHSYMYRLYRELL